MQSDDSITRRPANRSKDVNISRWKALALISTVRTHYSSRSLPSPITRLWSAKAAAILARINKDEDHVTQVIRIAPQRRQVVLITNGVRVPSQEPEELKLYRPISRKLCEGIGGFT